LAEALIASTAAEFAAALPGHGRLAGLDVGTKTVGLATCDAGWSYATPAETLRRTKFTADLELLKNFIVKHGIVRTPPAWAGILKGVTRDAVIELARGAGLTVLEEPLNRYDIYTADEAFFTGTASEIAPIREVDGRMVGAGRMGAVTGDLRQRFRQLVRG